MKKVGIIAGAVLLTVILAITALSLYLTDERLRSFVLPVLQDATNRDVQIERISYSLFRSFPSFALVIEHLEIPDETEPWLFRVDEVQLSVHLLALLRGEVRVQELLVEAPEFTFVIYEDGSTNLDPFLADNQTNDQPPAQLPDLDLSSIVLNRGQFGFTDHAAELAVQASDVSLTSALRFSEVLESTLELNLGSLDIHMNNRTLFSGLRLGLRQTSVLDLDAQTLQLREGTLDLLGLNLQLEGMLSDWGTGEIRTDLHLTSASDDFGTLLDLVPPQYEERTRELQTGGEFQLTARLQGLAGAESVPDFHALISIRDAFIQHNDVPEAISGITLDLEASNQEVILRSLEASAGQARLMASAHIQDPFDAQALFRVDGSFNADLSVADRYVPLSDFGVTLLSGNTSLAATASGALWQPEEAEFEVTMSLENGAFGHEELGESLRDLSFSVTALPNEIVLRSASMRAGSSIFSLSGTIADYLAEQTTFDLTLDGSVHLHEVERFYAVESEFGLLMQGLLDANVRITGALDDLMNLDLNGQIQADGIAIDSPDLMLPLSELQGTLLFRGKRLQTDGISFNFGSSDYFFSGQLEPYTGLLHEAGAHPPARIGGTFRSRRFDVDQFLDFEDVPEEPEPFYAWLPNLAGTVDTEIETLLFFGLQATNISGPVELNPAYVGSSGARASIYNGSMSGRFRWEVLAEDHTAFTFDGQLQGMRVEQLFTEFNPGGNLQLAEYARADFNATTRFYAEFDEFFEMDMMVLRTDGDFGMQETRMANHPVQNELSGLVGINEIRDLALDRFTAQYVIENGVMSLSDLNLTSRDLGLVLSGSQNLVTGELDYRAELVIPGNWVGRIQNNLLAEAADALRRDDGKLVVPVTLRGTSENPRVGIDESAVRQRLEQYLRERATEQGRELLDGVLNRLRRN